MCYQQMLEKGGRSQRDKLNRRRSTVDNTSELRRSTAVVYHSNNQALSKARSVARVN